MKKKLIFTFIFFVLITASTIDVASAAYSGSNYTSNSSLATKLDNVFKGTAPIFTNTNKEFPIGSDIGTYDKNDLSKNRYYWDNDNGWECYAYVNAVYYYLFGDSIKHGSGSFSNSKPIPGVQGSDNLSYEILAYAGVGCGACLRTTGNADGSYNSSTAHSMIILAYNSDNITYLHAASTNNEGTNRIVQVTTQSWAEFNQKRLFGKNRYVCHIIQPNETAGSSSLPSATTLEFRNVVYPDQYGIKSSGGFSLQGGYIISDADLVSIAARIEDSNGVTKSSGTLNLVGKVFSISCLDGRGKDMGQKFSSLNSLGANQSYKWILTAKDKNGRELPLVMNFTTIDASTHSTKTVSKRLGGETTFDDYTNTPENSLYVFTLDGIATARSTPYSVGAEGNTYVKGKTIKTIARVINQHGNTWYQAEDGYFIYGGDVSLVYTITSSTEKNYAIAQTTDSSNYPYDSSSLPLVLYCKNSYTTGSTITAVKTVKNSLNEVWYQLQDGTFIRADRCQEAATQATLSISGAAYPSGQWDKGKSKTLTGTITSNEKITEIVGSLYDSNTDTLVDKNIFSTKTNPCVVTPNATSYNLNSTAFDKQIKIGELPDGAFRYEVKATTVSGYTKVLINSEFTVGTGVQPVLPEYIYIGPFPDVHPDNRDFSLYIGNTKTLTIEYSPDNVTKKGVDWVISDPNIATIDQNGNVTAKAIGTAQITAISKYANDVFDVCAVHVECKHENVTYYETVPATCTGAGQYEYRCVLCGQWRSRGEISPLGHTYGNWTVTTAATCMATGMETHTCSRCGVSESRSIAALGHTWNVWNVTTPATCTANGVETRTCSRDNSHTETRSIDKIPHTFNKHVTTIKPTCTESGEERLDCSVCGAQGTTVSPLAPLGHIPEWITAQEPTCSEAGLKEQRCSRCNEVLNTETISAIPHTPGTWVTVKESTESEDGLKELRCAVCDALLNSEVLPKKEDYSFKIPGYITVIEEEAFSGIGAKSVKLPENVTEIERLAFANCGKLEKIYIPESTRTIHKDAFFGVTGLTIYGYYNSYAKTYAKENGIAFVAIDEIKPDSITGQGAEAVNVGQTVTLSASLAPNNVTNQKINWASSDASIGTVSDNGAVTGMKRGTVTITATADADPSLSFSFTITVRQPITITFDANGGSCQEGSRSAYAEYALGSELPVATRTYYSFDGWFTECSGGSRVTASDSFNTDTTLFAHWTIDTCSISFDANGGSCGTASKSINKGDAVGTLPTPERTYYSFDGWFTANGAKASASTTFTENTTLYAHWTRQTCTIYFDANGGSCGTPSVTIYRGEKVSGGLPSATRPYYTYDGWYTAAGTRMYDSTVFTESITLYAHWVDNSWSDWVVSSEKPENASIVDIKTQYCYRDQIASLSYGAWGDWTEARKTITDNTLMNEETTNKFKWWAAQCTSCGRNNPYHGSSSKCKSCGKTLTGGAYTHVFYYSDDSAGSTIDGRSNGRNYNGKPYWYTGEKPTVYRYRTNTYVYSWGAWTAWSDTAVTATSTREVQTRTMVRYQLP